MRSRRLDALAGALAAAVAVGAGELVAAIVGGVSPVVAVGDAVIDFAPGDAAKWAIDVFGSNDKPALLVTITVVSLAVGAALGPAAGRYRLVGSAAFAAFGLAGALAIARDPLVGLGFGIITAGAAAVAGLLALHLLLGAAEPEVDAGPQMPGRGVAGRRSFFALAGGAAGGAALAALTGRRLLGPPVDVEAQREAVSLPPPMSPVTARARGFDVAGISPLVTPNDDFYRIDTALIVPRVDASGWRMRVAGMVDRPIELTYDDLLAEAMLEHPATLVCVSNEVGGDLAGNAVWLGVPLPDLLERAGVQAGATQVVGRSVDGFTVGFPTEVALDGRPAMVAVGMNGQPLPAQHGFPARLIVPGLYGYVSATKWLSEIELTTLEAFDAYWVPRGWAKQAPIKTQSRIDVPRDGATVRPGTVAVAGVAWGGIRGLSRVEVRIRPAGDPDESAPWLEARLGEALSDSTWRQWVFDWPATPGNYVIAVRATDGQGQTQTSERRPPAPDGATGYHSVRARVEDA